MPQAAPLALLGWKTGLDFQSPFFPQAGDTPNPAYDNILRHLDSVQHAGGGMGWAVGAAMAGAGEGEEAQQRGCRYGVVWDIRPQGRAGLGWPGLCVDVHVGLAHGMAGVQGV